jgi:flagellar hook-basal body complex protein FliE
MNALSAIRAAFPAMSSLPALNTAAAQQIRPAELKELPASVGPMATPVGKPSESSFSSLLGRMVSDVNAKQSAAANSVAGLQSGQPVTLHQTMISMEEASLSFQLMVEVRNKLLESYQELMRMQV